MEHLYYLSLYFSKVIFDPCYLGSQRYVFRLYRSLPVPSPSSGWCCVSHLAVLPWHFQSGSATFSSVLYQQITMPPFSQSLLPWTLCLSKTVLLIWSREQSMYPRFPAFGQDNNMSVESELLLTHSVLERESRPRTGCASLSLSTLSPMHMTLVCISELYTLK